MTVEIYQYILSENPWTMIARIAMITAITTWPEEG
jgi:hypothetical protein